MQRAHDAPIYHAPSELSLGRAASDRPAATTLYSWRIGDNRRHARCNSESTGCDHNKKAASNTRSKPHERGGNQTSTNKYCFYTHAPLSSGGRGAGLR
jgi:hypothetical protein